MSEVNQSEIGKKILDYSRENWLLIAAMVVGVIVRLVPIMIWGDLECTRDECIYKGMGERILAGEGLTVSKKGWLAAPGYPYMLAFSSVIFGKMQAVKRIQLVLAAFSTWMMYQLGMRVGNAKKVGLLAAWMYALHPTLVFFAGTMWTETFYSTFLIGASLAAVWARGGDWRRGLVVGLAIGLAMLFRGAATYLLPIYVMGLLWPETWNKEALRASVTSYWRHAAATGVMVVLVVAPYSLSASKRHGGFMITDATLGHVAYLGNNTFEPLTFDYGNGMLTGPIYAKYLRAGRKPCSRRVPPVQSSDCEVERAFKWIENHPSEFISRIPMRVAQMMNPHSFLSRHLRWGYWPGIPFLLKELIVAYVALTSFMIIILGTLGAFGRAGGTYGVIAVGTVLYHIATVAGLYGMSRFRLPLEPLWMVYLALLIGQPRETLQLLRHSKPRIAGTVVTLPVLFWLYMWYFGTGFPGFLDL